MKIEEVEKPNIRACGKNYLKTIAPLYDPPLLTETWVAGSLFFCCGQS